MSYAAASNNWASNLFDPDTMPVPEGAAASSDRTSEHTYHDFSTYIKRGGKIEKHKKSDRNFPARLHTILSIDKYSHIIAWMPHGRAWKVLNKKLLVEEVLPEYFGQSKYASFVRQLSGWGFTRLHQTGPDFGCYYHECFLQGHPKLTVLMRRIPPGKGKPTQFDIRSEPDFFEIAEQYPLNPTGEQQSAGEISGISANVEEYHVKNLSNNYQRRPVVANAVVALNQYGNTAAAGQLTSYNALCGLNSHATASEMNNVAIEQVRDQHTMNQQTMNVPNSYFTLFGPSYRLNSMQPNNDQYYQGNNNTLHPDMISSFNGGTSRLNLSRPQQHNYSFQQQLQQQQYDAQSSNHYQESLRNSYGDYNQQLGRMEAMSYPNQTQGLVSQGQNTSLHHPILLTRTSNLKEE